MADTQDAEDPWVKLGRSVGSSTATPAAPNDDPWVAAGRKVGAQPMSEGPRTPIDVSTPPPDNYPALTGIPTFDNFVLGEARGARDVVATGANLAKWVNDRVPALAALDRFAGTSPQPMINQLAADRENFDASPAGQSYAGSAGRMVGGGLATAPLLGPAGAVVGAGLRTAGSVLPETGAAVNLLARAGSRAVQGGVGGGIYGAATSGGNDDSLGENILAGAKGGAIAGPVLGLVGDVAGGAGKAVKSTYNNLTGRAATQEVADTIAEARARAATQTPAPETEGATPSASPSAGMGGPQAGGAEATSESNLAANALTPDQAAAAKLRAFDLRMSQGAKMGEDSTEYVKGSRPTEAERLGDAHLAGIQRNVLAGEQRAVNFDDTNTQARVDHIADLAKDPVATDNLISARQTQGTEDLKSAWAGKGQADATPVSQHIKDTLATEDGKLKPVRAALNEVNDALHDSSGKLETDPQLLYGARRQITYMLSKTGRAQNASYGDEDVMRNLIQTRDVLDAQILKAAPRFQTFLDNWRAASPEIDKQEFLQKFHLGDAGNMTLEKVNQMMRSTRAGLNATGPHPAKALDEDTIDKMFNLRADLLRQSNRKLAAPAGSPTAYNLSIGAETGINAAHAAMGRVPVVGPVAEAQINRLNARNAQAKREGFITNLLAPHPLTPLN